MEAITTNNIYTHNASLSFVRFEQVYFSWHTVSSSKKYTALKNAILQKDNTHSNAHSTKQKALLQSFLLHDVSIDISHHEFVGIQGYSGAGKSTLAKLLAGTISPLSGNLYFKNEKQHYSQYKKNMHLQCQMVYQQPLASFNPRLSIYQSMYDTFTAYKKTYYETMYTDNNTIKTEISKKALQEAFQHELFELLQKVGISNALLHRLPHQVSGGELQRLSLVRVFIVKPKLIILDEPVSFLDSRLRKQILDIILHLFSCYKSSVVLISHLEEVLRYTCSSIYTLEAGMLKKISP